MKYLTIIAISIILGGGILASATRNAPHASIPPLEARPALEWNLYYLDGKGQRRERLMYAFDLGEAIRNFDAEHKIHDYIITCGTNTNWNYCVERDPYADH